MGGSGRDFADIADIAALGLNEASRTLPALPEEPDALFSAAQAILETRPKEARDGILLISLLLLLLSTRRDVGFIGAMRRKVLQLDAFWHLGSPDTGGCPGELHPCIPRPIMEINTS
jgi:hypothetical protein